MPNFFRQNKAGFRRAVVLGLDGMPHSLLQRLIAEGVMPNFQGLIAKGSPDVYDLGRAYGIFHCMGVDCDGLQPRQARDFWVYRPRAPNA